MPIWSGYRGTMGEPIQGGDQHNPRMDDELVREPGDEEDTPEAELWDKPGHDGVVTDADSDPDRTDLRSAIGQYVSLVDFPTQVRNLIAMAEGRDAPEEVLAQLKRLEPGTRFANTTELWDALGLSSHRRF
jgi:hypothetical protein